MENAILIMNLEFSKIISKRTLLDEIESDGFLTIFILNLGTIVNVDFTMYVINFNKIITN